MDKIYSTVSQSWFWQYFFSHFGWVDWILVIFIMIGIVIGLKSGASVELPRLLETALSLYVTFEYYSFFSDWLVRETPCPETYARVMTFALLGFLSWFLIRIVFEIIGKFMHLEIASPFKWIFGFFLGGLRYLLFFSLISYLLMLLPIDWIHRSYQVQSWSGQRLVQLPVTLYQGVKGFLTPRGVS